MDELRDGVAGAKVFTKLDLKERYHVIRMRKGDEHKTALVPDTDSTNIMSCLWGS